MRKHILLIVLLLVSFLLMFVLIFTFISGATFSGSGSGTPGDPYQITNCHQLQEIINWRFMSYRLMNNLDCQGVTVIPIVGFSGTFDGNGFKIYNLVSLANGLFESLNNSGTIQNLNLEGVSVNSGNNHVGGLVGKNEGGTIQNCFVSGNVVGFGYTGGLVGKNVGKIINSYSAVSVSGNNRVGGFVGLNEGGTITNSYSIGTVNGVGSVVGGLIGENSGVVTSSFWNTETSGKASSGGGTGKTTLEMKTESTFTNAGWDFVNVWEIEGGISYPYLLWQKDSDNDGVFDIHDLCPSENPNGIDADLNGCVDNLIDFSDAIIALPEELLSGRVENSLLSKINNTLVFVNQDKDLAAINMLGAFINQVEAQRERKISGETADMLIEYANNIIAQIEAGETP